MMPEAMQAPQVLIGVSLESQDTISNIVQADKSFTSVKEPPALRIAQDMYNYITSFQKEQCVVWADAVDGERDGGCGCGCWVRFDESRQPTD